MIINIISDHHHIRDAHDIWLFILIVAITVYVKIITAISTLLDYIIFTISMWFFTAEFRFELQLFQIIKSFEGCFLRLLKNIGSTWRKTDTIEFWIATICTYIQKQIFICWLKVMCFFALIRIQKCVINTTLTLGRFIFFHAAQKIRKIGQLYVLNEFIFLERFPNKRKPNYVIVIISIQKSLVI